MSSPARSELDILREFADVAPAMMWVTGPDNLCEWVNRTCLEYMGRTLEQEQGLGWADFVHPEDREVCLAAVQTAFERQEEYAIEYRVLRADGEYRWILDRARPRRDAAGRFAGFVGTAFDVTEQKNARMAAALEHARLYKEAQEANRVKDEFLATLSHELRTPLNAIVGWSHVLQQGPPDAPTVRRAADIIARNAQAQVQLISDLLDVSRIVAGKLRLNPGVVDLGAVVDAALDAVRPSTTARELTVGARVDRGARVWGDADRLQQIAWNLLTNAVKFTPRGGRIDVTLESQGGEHVLTVRDDGPGIEPGFLPYVFDRFRQADASTTRHHGGLGLGMAIVRHLVEAHGGQVMAHNRADGPGAVFTVRLPATTREEVPKGGFMPAGETPSDVLADVRVLVVDDEDDSREIVSTVLARQGADVLAASGAAEAFELVRSARPHVLVADIQMPGEDGYSLLRRLRALPADQGGLIPAASLSAYAGQEHRHAAFLAGFQTHLAKPVSPSEVVAAVAALARGRS
jgi:PAS domain S-box-containing protein